MIPTKIDLLMSEKVKVGEFWIQSHKNASGVHPQYLGPKMEWNGKLTLLRSESEWQNSRHFFWQWFQWAVLEGCTNRAWPIQPISHFLVKLPKWHFLTHAWNLKFFGPNDFIHEVPLAPSKCLSKWIRVDKWDCFQNSPQDFFSLLYFSFYLFFINKKPLS